MDPALLVAVGGFVLLGAITQRVTGMGFSLVASPLLVLVLGPHLGVQLSQVLNLGAAAIVLTQVWRHVELRRAVLLLVPAVVGVVPGAWLARQLPGPVLAIVIGGLVVVALVATAASERARVFTGPAGLASAGFLSGFMNVTASVGGPAIVLYALSTGWRHLPFVATVQVYFVGLNIASLAAQGWPVLDPTTWTVALGCLLAGLVAGNALARRVSHEAARRLVVVVALVGALAIVLKGVATLAGWVSA